MHFTTDEFRSFAQVEEIWSFDELRQLTVQVGYDEGRYAPPYSQLFMTAPELKTLKLYYTGFDQLNFTWSRLSHLLLHEVSARLKHLKEALEQATSLEDLSLETLAVRLDDQSPSHTSPVLLPRLTRLHFGTEENRRYPAEGNEHIEHDEDRSSISSSPFDFHLCNTYRWRVPPRSSGIEDVIPHFMRDKTPLALGATDVSQASWASWSFWLALHACTLPF